MIPTQGGQNTVKSIHSRVWVIGTVIGIVYTLLLVQIISVSISAPKTLAKNRYTEQSKHLRADIFDRNGVLIAGMLPTKGIRVNPRKVKDADTLTAELVKIFPDISYNDMYAKVTRKSSLVMLKNLISQSQYDAIMALGNTYGKDAVVVETKQQLYAHTNLITDAVGVQKQVMKILPNVNADVLHRKLTSGAGKVLIVDKVTKSQQQAINLITEMYNTPIFSYTDKNVAYIKPRQVENPKGLATALHHIFPDLSYDKIYKKLVRKADYVWIKRRTTPNQQYDTNALGNIALNLEDRFMRVYPQKRLFSHILGYVNVDNKGISGIEKSQNTHLSMPEKPITLTMDAGVQHIVRSEIQNIIDATDALGGVGIVMDVTNGDVISMVSLPDFNPNQLNEKGNRFNHATMGVYELGSTFKIINSAIALDSGKVKISDTFDAREPLYIGQWKITDYHAKRRVLDVAEIFIYSSNIGSALMAEKVGTDAQQKMMQKLNFLDRLDIVLPAKAKPLYPPSWNRVETMTISYGHGIAITPLHLTTAVASLINGGEYYPPRFIKTDTPPASHRVVSEKTSDTVRKLMWLNTLDGSGRKSAVKGFVVGGKTGSADKTKETGGYEENSLISSYIAGFPMHDPKFVVYVMVDSPKAGEFTNGNRPTGGQVAAPTVQNIVSRIAPLLGVNPVDKNSEQIKALKIPSYEKRKYRGKQQS